MKDENARRCLKAPLVAHGATFAFPFTVRLDLLASVMETDRDGFTKPSLMSDFTSLRADFAVTPLLLTRSESVMTSFGLNTNTRMMRDRFLLPRKSGRKSSFKVAIYA